MYQSNRCYFFALLVTLNIFSLEAAKNFSMTSHGKIVICNVAEVSTNNAYNIDEHDLNLCTHVIYFTQSDDIALQGSLNALELFGSNFETTPTFDKLPEIRKKYPNLKICFGINKLPDDLLQVISDESKRKQFVEHGIDYILKNHFDGLDLSWDISRNGFNTYKYLQFVKELRENLQSKNLSLSGKISSEGETRNDIQYLSALAHQLDLIHLTPDYQNDPRRRKYYTLEEALRDYASSEFENVIDKLIETGVPSSKIIAGFNFGGLKLDTAYRRKYFSGYDEICKTISGDEWVKSFDSDANLALAKKKDFLLDFWRYIFVFENIRAIVHKIRFAMKRNLAGAMASYINNDDLHGHCPIYNEKYEDFASPHIAINLTISEENQSIPLLNTINLMMVMSLFEIEQEAKHDSLLPEESTLDVDDASA